MERLEEIRKKWPHLMLSEHGHEKCCIDILDLIAEVDRLRAIVEEQHTLFTNAVKELEAALAAKEEALRLFQASTRTYMILVERMGSWTHDPEGLLPEMKRISGELLALSTPTPAEEK